MVPPKAKPLSMNFTNDNSSMNMLQSDKMNMRSMAFFECLSPFSRRSILDWIEYVFAMNSFNKKGSPLQVLKAASLGMQLCILYDVFMMSFIAAAGPLLK